MQLPTTRTVNDTRAAHVADHNEVHRLHNILDGSLVSTPTLSALIAANTAAILAETARAMAAEAIVNDPKIPVVLKFTSDGSANPAQVHHGEHFWPVGVNLTGGWLWEFWCRYNAGSVSGGYLISEGYGGAHATLYGLLGGQPNGNTWDGTTVTSFAGSYTAQENEWLHTSVGWDGAARIYIWVNGIVVGTKAFAGPRQAQEGGLYIGGSDHLCFTGCLAQVRGFEGVLPLRTSQAGLIQGGYGAERAMGARFPTFASLNFPVANFLAHYSCPGSIIVPDLSSGYNGTTHPGRLWGSLNSDFLGERSTWPGPQWITDPTAPFRQDLDPARIRTIPTAPATPGGAKIFDSFSRTETIPTWAAPTLGSTETGSLGPLAWQSSGTHTWGVFDGHAVYCGGGYDLAWVNNNSGDMDVRVTRDHTNGLDDTGANAGAGLAFRVQDALNFWALRTVAGVIHLDSFVGSITTPTNLATYSPATTWVTLRVVTSGTSITAYVDNGSGGWTTLGTINNSTFQTAVGAGMYAFFGSCSNVHYDNFTVI